MVRQLSLFSENEFMEDISTKDLRYSPRHLLLFIAPLCLDLLTNGEFGFLSGVGSC